jgi:hypothetical protein
MVSGNVIGLCLKILKERPEKPTPISRETLIIPVCISSAFIQRDQSSLFVFQKNTGLQVYSKINR